MERRRAIKNLGMAFGYSMSAPTIIGLVQSCKSKVEVDWILQKEMQGCKLPYKEKDKKKLTRESKGS